MAAVQRRSVEALFRHRITHLFLSTTAFFAVAVAQPVLDLLGQNPQFFVAHDAVPSDIFFVLIGLTLGFPLLLGALEAGVAAINRSAGRALHLSVLAVLGAAAVLRVLSRSLGDGPSGYLLAAVALAAGAALALLYETNATLRTAVAFGALIPLALIGWFALSTPSGDLLNPKDIDVEPAKVGRPAPIVYVIFDEFPLSTLLDRRGRIDEEMFPNFARLAGTSTWFRDAVTVSERTAEAVPSLMTGRYPEDRLTTYADHPRNIFTLLSGTYEFVAAEPVTQLCPPKKCEIIEADPPDLLEDISLVAAHTILPSDLVEGLPPVDEGWARFGRPGDEPGPANEDRTRSPTEVLRPATDEFEGLLASIGPSARPTLYLGHFLMPHGPWKFLPSGQTYLANYDLGDQESERGHFGRSWIDDEWATKLGYQRHLLQTRFVDRLVGRLLNRLEETNLFDDALVVVAADHGAAFVPGQPRRGAAEETAHAILHVPLFIKEPGQREGRIESAPIDSVDVMPAIMDAIGAPTDGFDGFSAFDVTEESGSSERLLNYPNTTGWRSGWKDVVELARQKFVDLGTARGPIDLWSIAPEGTARLLGTEIGADVPVADLGVVSLTDPDVLADVDPKGYVVPSLLSGEVQFEDEPEDQAILALAIDDRIAAVTQTYGEGSERSFYAMIRPDRFVAGSNEVQVFVVGPRNSLTELPWE